MNQKRRRHAIQLHFGSSKFATRPFDRQIFTAIVKICFRYFDWQIFFAKKHWVWAFLAQKNPLFAQCQWQQKFEDNREEAKRKLTAWPTWPTVMIDQDPDQNLSPAWASVPGFHALPRPNLTNNKIITKTNNFKFWWPGWPWRGTWPRPLPYYFDHFFLSPAWPCA